MTSKTPLVPPRNQITWFLGSFYKILFKIKKLRQLTSTKEISRENEGDWREHHWSVDTKEVGVSDKIILNNLRMESWDWLSDSCPPWFLAPTPHPHPFPLLHPSPSSAQSLVNRERYIGAKHKSSVKLQIKFDSVFALHVRHGMNCETL